MVSRNSKNRLVAALAVAATFGAGSAYATTNVILSPGSGWHYGEDHLANDPTMYNFDLAGSANDFTLTLDVPTAATFDVVDGFLPGDIFSISINGSPGVLTTFNLLGAVSPNGPYGAIFAPTWTDPRFSRAQFALSKGSYTVTISDTNTTGLAGFGVRLDAAGAPEPASWALMIFGFGCVGAMARRRRGPLSRSEPDLTQV